MTAGVPISAAAEIIGIHPQTLRAYERQGLVSPRRTSGNLRIYGAEELDLLRRIHTLTARHGLNLNAVRRVLLVEATILALAAGIHEAAEVVRGKDCAIADEMHSRAREAQYALPSADRPALPSPLP
jgi:MerR family transcriptional regulator/heat shock protein HspR